MKRVYTPDEAEELIEAIRDGKICAVCKYAGENEGEEFERNCAPCFELAPAYPNFELYEE